MRKFTRAINVTNGDIVIVDGAQRTVHAAHYAGPIDGTGTTTLELGSGREWQGPAQTALVTWHEIRDRAADIRDLRDALRDGEFDFAGFEMVG